jgi:O-antigen ligase
MKSLFTKAFSLGSFEDETEKLRFVLLLLFVFVLPFDIFYSNILFITFCGITLIDLRLVKLKKIPKQFWLFQLVFFLSLAGYVYSNHKTEAAFVLERQLTIFLFPIFIPLALSIDAAKIQMMMRVLVITTICTILYLFLSMAYIVLFELQMPFFKTIFSGAFFNHQFSSPINMHAGYLSLYVALSIFYLVYLFGSVYNRFLKQIIVVGLTILFSGLFFLAARNSILAVLFILLFIFPLFKTKNKWRHVFISICGLIICLILFSQISFLRERFSRALITDIKLSTENTNIYYQGAEPRFERWLGAADLIKKSPWIGYGTGDEIPMLRTRYIKRELYISYLENFNAHNQYLSMLVKNGVLGLILFLFAFIYYLLLAVKSRDLIYVSFLLLFLIGFYTENILDANKGIIFFALFNTCFGYNLVLNNTK